MQGNPNAMSGAEDKAHAEPTGYVRCRLTGKTGHRYACPSSICDCEF